MALTTASFDGKTGAFPSDVADQIVSAIVAGAPFANSITRRESRGDLVFPIINSVTGQAWIAEDALIPDVVVGDDSVLVAVKKLAGIVMLTRESVEDATFDTLGEVTRIVQDAFSRDLDDGMINGDGTGSTPTGVLAVAPAANGSTLTAGIAAAIADIGEAGGRPSHVALSPTDYATELARESDAGPIYRGGISDLLGLAPVTVPGLVQPLVYDASSVYLVVGRNWTITPSQDYAPAFQRDRIALRITGRFAVGAPVPERSIRKVEIA